MLIYLCKNSHQEQISEALLEQAHRDLGDYFEYFVERVNPDIDVRAALRFQITARLAGRIFERFHVDVGIDNPIIGPIEYLSPPQYLEFAEIESASIPCYPVTQHIAEKIHALIRPRPVESSRVKDLVDLLIFTELDTQIQSERLFSATQAVFEAYQDILPAKTDQIPAAWRPKYQQMVKSMGLPFSDFEDAIKAAREFINPVLDGTGRGIWDPKTRKWR